MGNRKEDLDLSVRTYALIGNFKKISYNIMQNQTEKRIFTYKDYIEIFKHRGILFCFSYFLQAHMYDLKYGTDTHMRNDPKDYIDKPEDFEHGIWYVCSRTDILRRSLFVAKKHLGPDFKDYQFVDLGAGKGKSVLVYSQMYGNIAHHKSVAIEYYAPLSDISSRNIEKLGFQNLASAHHDDARNICKYISSKCLLIYLFNPFDWKIFESVLEKVADKNIFIIYVDPVFRDSLKSVGFEEVEHFSGKYPNQTVSFLKKCNCSVKNVSDVIFI